MRSVADASRPLDAIRLGSIQVGSRPIQNDNLKEK